MTHPLLNGLRDDFSFIFPYGLYSEESLICPAFHTSAKSHILAYTQRRLTQLLAYRIVATMTHSHTQCVILPAEFNEQEVHSLGNYLRLEAVTWVGKALPSEGRGCAIFPGEVFIARDVYQRNDALHIFGEGVFSAHPRFPLVLVCIKQAGRAPSHEERQVHEFLREGWSRFNSMYPDSGAIYMFVHNTSIAEKRAEADRRFKTTCRIQADIRNSYPSRRMEIPDLTLSSPTRELLKHVETLLNSRAAVKP